MRRPGLVAVDIDGTVLRHGSGHQASPAVVDALRAVRDAGVPVVVATARAECEARKVVAGLGLTDGLHVYSHGGLVHDLGAGRDVHRSHFDAGAAVRAFLDVDPAASFVVEHDEGGWSTCENYVRGFPTTWRERLPLDALTASRTILLGVKVTCDGTSYGPTDHCPHGATAVQAAGLDATVYRTDVGIKGWIAVLAAGTSKASGLGRVAEEYGVDPADVVAFGDSSNDLPMFAWAGHAVAMGQALDDVKAAADEVAPAVTEDGVATVLRRWFPR
ncbi:HAD family hydrolase [Phytomonospora sp. NPDC050363]|uniref:HAD family hydrolase n=1 Tax=Phytomonospora sp. NPDC050363 TaxID=3155642 RepID=UPI00340E2F2C